jgi:hypothetical protein
MVTLRPSRRTVVRLVLRSIAVAGAVALTVALAEQPSRSAFTGATGDGGNQVTASGDFCASPGGTTLTPSADSTGHESTPTTTYGTHVNLGAFSELGANARAVLRFSPLPTVPAHCGITSATLRLRATSAVAGRTIDVYRVNPAAAVWTEAGLSWNNLPATTGTAVASASRGSAGWQEWTVTPLMTGLYAGVNNGFLVRDRTEGSGVAAQQWYDSRDTATPANRPQLVLTWG